MAGGLETADARGLSFVHGNLCIHFVKPSLLKQWLAVVGSLRHQVEAPAVLAHDLLEMKEVVEGELAYLHGVDDNVTRADAFNEALDLIGLAHRRESNELVVDLIEDEPVFQGLADQLLAADVEHSAEAGQLLSELDGKRTLALVGTTVDDAGEVGSRSTEQCFEASAERQLFEVAINDVKR